MRILFSTILFIACWSLCNVSANPTIPYLAPLISEVKITDSTHWAIELDGGSYSDGYPLPITANLGRLRIASSKTIYTYKCLSDRNIHVITRDSIINIPQSENVVIKAFDTIQILDIPWCDTGYNITCRWSFPVRPIAPGNSLIDFWNEFEIHNTTPPFETTRPSIGSIGNYSTIHNLHIVDEQGNSLPQVYIYRSFIESNIDPNVLLASVKGAELLTTLTYSKEFSYQITLNNTEGTLAFCSNSFTQYYGGPFSNVLKWPPSNYLWYGAYIDTLLSTNDPLSFLGQPPLSKQSLYLPFHWSVSLLSALPEGKSPSSSQRLPRLLMRQSG